MLGVVVLAALLLVGFVDFSGDEGNRMREQAVARHLQEIAQATRAYAKHYEKDIVEALTATGANKNQKIVLGTEGSTCTASDFGGTPEAANNITSASDAHIALDALPCLHDTNFWPEGFQAKNVYDQSHYLLFVRRNDSADDPVSVQMLLFTHGGEQIPTASLTQIASYTEGLGGFLSDDEPYNKTTDDDGNSGTPEVPEIHGAFSAWSLPNTLVPGGTNGYRGTGKFESGHLAFNLGVFPTATAEQPNGVVRKGTSTNPMTVDLRIKGQNLIFAGCDTAQGMSATTCKLRTKQVRICTDPTTSTPAADCVTLKRSSANKPEVCRQVTNPSPPPATIESCYALSP